MFSGFFIVCANLSPKRKAVAHVGRAVSKSLALFRLAFICTFCYILIFFYSCWTRSFLNINPLIQRCTLFLSCSWRREKLGVAVLHRCVALIMGRLLNASLLATAGFLGLVQV